MVAYQGLYPIHRQGTYKTRKGGAQMEKKKLSKEKIGILVAIVLAALSLSLVVYDQWLSPAAQEAHREEAQQREAQKRAEEAEKEKEKKAKDAQEEWETLFAPEEDWTDEDYDQALKEAVLYYANCSDLVSLDYTIDSEEELQSVRLYDYYVTNASRNKDENGDADLVVRYVMRYDQKAEDSAMALWFTMEMPVYVQYRLDHDGTKPKAEWFMDFVRSQQGSISYKGHLAFLEFDEKTINRAEGSMTHVTPQDLEFYYGGGPSAGPDEL